MEKKYLHVTLVVEEAKDFAVEVNSTVVVVGYKQTKPSMNNLAQGTKTEPILQMLYWADIIVTVSKNT